MLAALGVSPFFREALGNYFHPEDVLALGLVLLAVSLAFERRWVWAGVLLGLAIGSKQWALLALPALVLVAPGRRAKANVLGGALGGAAVLFLPFILMIPGSAWHILTGPAPVPGGLVPQTTLVGMLRQRPFELSVAGVKLIARLLPGLVALVLAAVLILRGRFGRLSAGLRVEQVLGLLLACLAVRLIVDCIALSYYALPVSVLIAVIDTRRSRLPVFAVASSFLLAAWYGTGLARRLLDPWTGAAVFTVCVAAIAGGALNHLHRQARLPGSRDGAGE